jgi:hypothetical protein
VSEGAPPICSEIAIAIGVVTDLGAKESTTSELAPQTFASRTAEIAAVEQPQPIAALTGSASARTRGSSRASGTASATVAGPSNQCRTFALSK